MLATHWQGLRHTIARRIYPEVAEVEAERDFLLILPQSYNSGLGGPSADALTMAAVWGGIPHSVPNDKDDLRRCEQTYDLMPSHLQQRVLPLLEEWRKGVRTLEAIREKQESK